MASQPPGIPGARVLQEVGILTMRLAIADEQIQQLQKQNEALGKQLRETLAELASLKADVARPPEVEHASPASN